MYNWSNNASIIKNKAARDFNEAIRNARNYAGKQTIASQRAKYGKSLAGNGVMISFRSRGFVELINKLDAFDAFCGEGLLADAVMEWSESILKDLDGKFPHTYDGDWVNRALFGHANEHWHADFGVGATGVSASIWNDQMSSKGFDYVQYVNDNKTNQYGTPFKSKYHYLEKIIHTKNARFANKKYLLPALRKAIKRAGLG